VGVLEDGCGKHTDRKVLKWHQKAPRSYVANILQWFRKIKNRSTTELQELQENSVALKGSYIMVIISIIKKN